MKTENEKTHLRLAKSSKTGLYFDGFGFNALNVLQAQEIAPRIKDDDFRLIWGDGIQIINIELEPLTPYDLARAYVLKQQRDRGQKSFCVRIAGKEHSRKIIVPAKSGEPVWCRFKGNDIALVLRNGTLCSDWE